MAVRRRKTTPAPIDAESPEAQKAKLLRELSILDTQKRALDAAISDRKTAIGALMDQAGDRSVKDDYHGEVSYTPRRSFRVTDREVLQKRLTKQALAEGFKPSATVVDALAKKGISVAGMIDIGVSENLVYRPASTKDAEARRKAAIEECRRQAEAKVTEMVAKL